MRQPVRHFATAAVFILTLAAVAFLSLQSPDSPVNLSGGDESAPEKTSTAPESLAPTKAFKTIYGSTSDPTDQNDVNLPQGASISGYVVDDLGTAMQGMRVDYVTPDGQKIKGEISDAAGAFTIRCPQTGTYRLVACVPHQMSSYDSALPVELAENEVRTGVELAYNGTTFAVSGTVRNSLHEPVEGATVWACVGYTHTFPPEDFFRSVQTDSKGNYSLNLVSDVQYDIVATHPRHYGRGSNALIERHIEDHDLTILEFATVTGRAIDAASGKPVPVYKIACEHGLTENSNPFGLEFSPVTDADGRFTLESVQAGNVTLLLRAPGYTPGLYELPNLQHGQNIQDINIPLVHGPRLEGAVVNKRGEPVAGAKIFPVLQDRGLRLKPPAALTNDLGFFVLDDLGEIIPALSVVHPDYPVAIVDVAPASGPVTSVSITLNDGATIEGFIQLNGEPAQRVEIDVRAPHIERPIFASSDESGFYRLEKLPAGTLALVAACRRFDNSLYQSQNVYIKGDETQTVSFDFEHGESVLEGTVTFRGEATDGASLAIARLLHEDRTERLSTQLASGGSFEIPGLSAGEYSILATKPGEADQSGVSRMIKVTLPDTGTTHVEIPLGVQHISGRISGAANYSDIFVGAHTGHFDEELGRAPTDSVRPGYYNTPPVGGSKCNEHGEYEISGVPDGEITLIVSDFSNPYLPMAVLAVEHVTVKVDGKLLHDIHLR